MKLFQTTSCALLALAAATASVYAATECPEKKSDYCLNRVSVNVSDVIYGLIDDVPRDVIDAYIEASALCIKCVDEESVKIQTGNPRPMNTANNVCSNQGSSCGSCNSLNQRDNNCESCCGVDRCVGCGWNLGPNTNRRGNSRVCDSGCTEPAENEKCSNYFSDCYGCGTVAEGTISCKDCCGLKRCKGCGKSGRTGNSLALLGDHVCDDSCGSRRLEESPSASAEHTSNKVTAAASNGEYEAYDVYFNIDVCMDDVSPLDSSMTYYTDYSSMLEDFSKELSDCYENRDEFLTTWSSIAAERGIDLPSMARDPYAGLDVVAFGETNVETSYAKVTTYDSSGSHRATSYMMFYGALGFVAAAAFAVVGTAAVVRVLNKRKVEKEEQAAHWISEMARTETCNPVAGA